jgi:UDP-galactopyranose mutase
MPTSANYLLYEKYAFEAGKLKNVIFTGRLGAYRYLNMDAACLEGMKVARGLLP